MGVGDLIREIREKKGISSAELGRRIGMSRSYMSRIELGDRPVKLDILSKIAEVLDTPIEYFVSDDEKRELELDNNKIIVIDKDKHNLQSYTDEDILKWIKEGLERSRENSEKLK